VRWAYRPDAENVAIGIRQEQIANKPLRARFALGQLLFKGLVSAAVHATGANALIILLP
jgi:hypothetical protein